MNIWGHRGASGSAPENTLEAFQLAIEQKADGVELDVQRSKDGVLVVIHDESLERVSDGMGYVKDYTLQELKSFNFNKMHPEFGPVRIPTLEEVYALLKNTDLTINTELKNSIFLYEGMETQVLTLAKKMNMEDQIVYSSFNHYSLIELKRLATYVKAGILFSEGFALVPEYARKIGMSSVHPAASYLKYPGFIERCHELGLEINVWNVRDKEVVFCAEHNIHAVITNFIDRTQLLLT